MQILYHLSLQGNPGMDGGGVLNCLIPRAAPPSWMLPEVLVLLIPALGVRVCMGMCAI